MFAESLDELWNLFWNGGVWSWQNILLYKGVQKLEFSKNILTLFHDILIKICISFPVVIFNFGSLWYQDCFEDMPRRDFGWRVKVSLRKNETCTFTPGLNPGMPKCIMTGKYCSRTIISRGLHIFLVLHFSLWFMIKSNWY